MLLGCHPQEELEVLDRLPHVCPVCAYHEWNLDGLVEMAWEYLDLIRVYTKPKARTAAEFPLQQHAGACRPVARPHTKSFSFTRSEAEV